MEGNYRKFASLIGWLSGIPSSWVLFKMYLCATSRHSRCVGDQIRTEGVVLSSTVVRRIALTNIDEDLIEVRVEFHPLSLSIIFFNKIPS